MKLIVQIPSFTEEEVLPVTLAGPPREVDGFDAVEWLVVDDGSTAPRCSSSPFSSCSS